MQPKLIAVGGYHEKHKTAAVGGCPFCSGGGAHPHHGGGGAHPHHGGGATKPGPTNTRGPTKTGGPKKPKRGPTKPRLNPKRGPKKPRLKPGPTKPRLKPPWNPPPWNPPPPPRAEAGSEPRAAIKAIATRATRNGEDMGCLLFIQPTLHLRPPVNRADMTEIIAPLPIRLNPFHAVDDGPVRMCQRAGVPCPHIHGLPTVPGTLRMGSDNPVPGADARHCKVQPAANATARR